MYFSAHSLHSPVVEGSDHQAVIANKVAAILADQRRIIQQFFGRPVPADSIEIPLTTVSLNSNFDAYINVGFRGERNGPSTPLLLDSGNTTLVVPRWEDIEALPDSAKNYRVLGIGCEPWGSPAKIVRGPIEIATKSGPIYSIENCVFYACTDKPRTANFGAGCIRPWSASGWNIPHGVGVTLQAPLSYNTEYPYAVFNYAPAETILASLLTPLIAGGSSLVLSRSAPAGFVMFDTIPNLEWMSVVPKSLSIGNTRTAWPGTVGSPIAMVDTGGGPVFLSDPEGYLCDTAWPAGTMCPTWTRDSTDCQCLSDPITVELGDARGSISYVIDPNRLPGPARGLTLVMCKMNSYMEGQRGMNIGGISALFNSILVDYVNARVGFRGR